jgi:hypothetical protein
MNYISKKEFENKINKFLDDCNQRDGLDMIVVKELCEQGIPAVEIAVKNIPIECFKKGLEKWLDGLG